MRPRLLARAALALLALVVAAIAWPRSASAQSIAGRPGAHRDYAVEIEPHLAFGFGGHGYSDGIGGGVRFNVPVVHNGFITTINDNVAIGFGADYLHYSWNCGPFYDCPSGNRIWVPLDLQWSFFLSQSWSVFGELGLAFSHGWWSGGGPCYTVDRFGARHAYDCGWGGSSNDLDLIGGIGARWQFSPSANLVARLSWPYASLGVSFW